MYTIIYITIQELMDADLWLEYCEYTGQSQQLHQLLGLGRNALLQLRLETAEAIGLDYKAELQKAASC